MYLKFKINIHAPNSTTLYKFIPQDMMPEEYGGTAGKIRLFKAEWIRRIEKER